MCATFQRLFTNAGRGVYKTTLKYVKYTTVNEIHTAKCE